MGVKKYKKKALDICVYLGPTIHGTIQHGTIFKGSKSQILQSLKPILEKNPLIASMIVSGEELPEARIKAKIPGNLLNINYQRLISSINKI